MAKTADSEVLSERRARGDHPKATSRVQRAFGPVRPRLLPSSGPEISSGHDVIVAATTARRPHVGLQALLYASATVAVMVGQMTVSGTSLSTHASELLAWNAFASGIALTLGALELARYIARRERLYLIIGVAMSAVGLIQATELIGVLPGVHATPLESWAQIVAWNSFAARLLLPVLVILGAAVLPATAEARGKRGTRPSTYLVAAGLTTAVGAVLPWTATLRPFVPEPTAVSQPQELWLAALLLLAILTVWRSPDLTGTIAGRALALGLFIAFLDQVVVLPFVPSPFSNTAAMAEAVSALVYIVTGAGVIANIMLMSRREREADDALRAEVLHRRRAEQALAKEAARFARSNEELQQFAYVASHDLQEPLRMVTSYLQLIERRYTSQLDDDGREFMHFAVDGATRMKRLINDLLVYSRVGTRGKEPVLTEVSAALEDAVQNLEVAIEESSASITADALPTVWADPGQLTQLLQNLLGNAIKFQAPGTAPDIRIHARDDQGYAVITVQDNGIGIDPKYHDRVFGVFQRLHGDGTYDGSGIGLAVCRKIVERHDGKIWLESPPKGGTTIHFTLPTVAPSESEPEADDPTPDDPDLERHVRSLIERAMELV